MQGLHQSPSPAPVVSHVLTHTMQPSPAPAWRCAAQKNSVQTLRQHQSNDAMHMLAQFMQLRRGSSNDSTQVAIVHARCPLRLQQCNNSSANAAGTSSSNHPRLTPHAVSLPTDSDQAFLSCLPMEPWGGVAGGDLSSLYSPRSTRHTANTTAAYTAATSSSCTCHHGMSWPCTQTVQQATEQTMV